MNHSEFNLMTWPSRARTRTDKAMSFRARGGLKQPGEAKRGDIVEVTEPARWQTKGPEPGRLGRLALFMARHRWPVIAVWIVLTLIGGVAAGKLSSRWYQSFSIPGKSAYAASPRTLKAFGVGGRPPSLVVFHTRRDPTQNPA